jgi:type II secretory pathway pseudopilin PulG
MTPMSAAPPPQRPPPRYALPTVALGFSLVSVCFCPAAVVGLVLGLVALVRLGREPQLPGKGFALAAMIIPVALVPVGGVAAAIAIPAFITYQARSRQQECQLTLKRLYQAQQTFRIEHGHWASTFDELRSRPEAGNRYTYFLGPEEVVPVDARFSGGSASAHERELDRLDLTPGADDERLLMACVGNVDSDEALDVWTVDESGRVVHVADDVDQR